MLDETYITTVANPFCHQCVLMHDFMSDALTDAKKTRVFNVINDCNHEAVSIYIGLSCPELTMAETLESLMEK